MSIAGSPHATPYDRIKRAGDVLVAGSALLLLAPVLAGTAAAVRLGMGPGVLFRQPRPGRGGEEFEVLKFRTMHTVDASRGLVTDAERMTRLGDMLRATSLDELPGLVNVLRGEMSLVGPRPLRMRYLERYSAEQSHRHDVLPGLTGLAQVSGRNAVTWDDRFDLDLEYVRTRGVLTDLRILAATVPKVLRREGIAEAGQATMRDFFGPRRIGGHVLHEVPERLGTAWEVRARDSGTVLARCECVLVAAGRCEAEIRIAVLADVADPATVRDRAAEMMLGVAREQEADAVRLRVEVDRSDLTDLADLPDFPDLPDRLGFTPQGARVPSRGEDTAVLVRELEGDHR